jgi:MoaA/NifB/PqqE/SkfB family radical SAM enzyme
MCYQTDFSPRFNMPPALYRERLKEAYPYVSRVKLQGGEPTIMKNCREAATLLRAYPNVKLSVTTNGIFIDEFWHETLAHQGAYVNVSINAASEEAYNKIVILGRYKQVIANVKRLAASRSGNTLALCLSAVILKENVFEIAQLVQLAADLGIASVEFIVDPILSFAGLPSRTDVLAECGRARTVEANTAVKIAGLERFESHFTTPERQSSRDQALKSGSCNMCLAPFNHLVVDWKGDARVCCTTWVKLGNLNDTSLVDMWASSRIEAFRKKMRQGSYLWCAPDCDANPAPTRLSLIHKYAYQVREDPRQFARKINQKILQLRGKWVKVKNKAPKPPVEQGEPQIPLVQIGTADKNGKSTGQTGCSS